MVKGQLVTIYVDPLNIISPKDHEGMGILIRQLPHPKVWNPRQADPLQGIESDLSQLIAKLRQEQPPEPETGLLTSWPPEDAPVEKWRFCWVDNPAYVKGIDPEELDTVGEERYILVQ